MIKTALLALDGSAYTEAILKYGVDFAKKFNAHLRVLTVVDIRIFEWAVAIGVEGFAPIIPSATYQEESQKLLEEKANKVLERASEELKEAGVSFETEKESGSPVDVICEKARLTDIVVMGSKGEFAKWSEKMLGATLEATTRLCIRPIFISQKEYRPIRKILMAYDGSLNSNKALPWAGYFAQHFQAPLTVLNVNDDEEEGQSILQDAMSYLKAYNIKTLTTLKKDGEPADKIVEIINELNIDLIIMGGYGHSRIREAILGSTTVQVMRRAGIPILMVK